MTGDSGFAEDFFENLLDCGEEINSRSGVSLIDHKKQRALSLAHDLLLTIQRSSGMEEKVEVKNRHGLGCASITAVVPKLYLSKPWQLALAIVEASNVQIAPTSDGNIKVTLHYSGYYHKIA